MNQLEGAELDRPINSRYSKSGRRLCLSSNQELVWVRNLLAIAIKYWIMSLGAEGLDIWEEFSILHLSCTRNLCLQLYH